MELYLHFSLYVPGVMLRHNFNEAYVPVFLMPRKSFLIALCNSHPHPYVVNTAVIV
jgi:hypothetical protein